MSRKPKALPKWLDKHLPPRGPCAFCGGPDARHRIVDAIRGRVKAGDSTHSVARDYDLTVAVVNRLVYQR